MAIQGLIFDCDGTLVDSEGLSVELMVALLAESGVAMDGDALMARFRGRRFATMLDELCGEFTLLDAEWLTAEFRARTPVLFRERLQAMPGALELVRNLEIERCVASNGPRNKIETSLTVTGLLPYFVDRIVSAYEVGAWKPDPALIRAAAASMKLPAEHCLLVEDSLPGVQAGLAAGVRVAAYRLGDEELGELGERARQVVRIGELADVRALL